MLSSTSLGSAALGLHKRFKQHQKHKEKLKAERQVASSRVGGGGGDDGGEHGDAHPPVPVEDREADVCSKRCFFSGHLSDSTEENLQHMLKYYGFTIPMVDKCRDIEGLLQYLAVKLNGLLCLVCGTKTKRYASLTALRGHMREAGHERIVLTSEYNDFYSVSLDDGQASGSLPSNLIDKEEQGALVLANGQRVMQKDAPVVGAVRSRPETAQQAEERRLLTQAANQQHTALLKQFREETRKSEKKKRKIQHREMARLHHHDLKVGTKTGMAHPKGFEGDGCN